MSRIRETVARAIAASQSFAWGLNYDTALESDREHCGEIADAAITAFLAAASSQGWHMRPDEATEEMTVAGCQHENMGDMAGRYRVMTETAPEFDWREE